MRHVPHCHLPGPWDGAAIRVSDATATHLGTVLRRQVDTPVSYTDGAGIVGDGRWMGDTVIRGSERATPAPLPSVVIAVAPPKSKDRQRFIVEKLQELAVSRLIWVRTDRGQAMAPRRDRAAAWAIGALEQSRGAWLMDIEEEEEGLAGIGPALVLDAEAPVALADIDVGDRALVIGPEGGLTDAERATHETVRLGSTILRTETAAIAAAAILRSG